MAVATCNDALADNESRMRDDFLLRSPQTRKSVTWVPGTPLPRCLNIAQLAHARVVLVLVVVQVRRKYGSRGVVLLNRVPSSVDAC